MNDATIKQIRSLYGEILGIADHLPSSAVSVTIVQLYNSAIDRLDALSGENFDRFKVPPNEGLTMNGKLHHTSSVLPRMTAALSTLEYTYGLRKTQRGEQQPTMIVTVNNNNQLSVTIVPIQDILQKITDDDLRKDVEELKVVIENSKDKKKASNLLNKIQEKSWDVFIALLPVVLQKLGG